MPRRATAQRQNGFQSRIWKTYSQQKAQDPNAHKTLFDAHNNGNINISNYNAYMNQNSAMKMQHSKQFKNGGADHSKQSIGQVKFDNRRVKILVGDQSRNTIKHNKYYLSKENGQ